MAGAARDALVVIPCRLGSRRFPGKPLAETCGKPLFWWVWDSVRRWPRAIETVIATPDEEILQAASALGVPARFTAPGHRHGSLRALQVLQEHPRREAARYLVNVQGDQPEASEAMLDALCETLGERSAQVATLACPFRSCADRLNGDAVKVYANRDGLALYFTRESIPASLRHVGIYAFDARWLPGTIANAKPNVVSKAEGLEQLEWLWVASKIRVVRIEGDPVSIDAPKDLVRLTRKLRRGNRYGAEVRG